MLMLPLILFAVNAYAADPEAALKKEAMDNTVQMLTDPVLYQAAAQENGETKKAASQLDQITNDPAQQQKIREIAASIFKKMGDKTGNDSKSINESLSAAQSNPEAFAQSISAEDMAKIRSLASEIEKQKK